MHIFPQVVKFVNESFDSNTVQIIHFERTVHFVKILNQDADEAFLVAAYSHDIARAFTEIKQFKGRFKDPSYLKAHQDKSAKIIGEFLKKINAINEFIERVKMLVSRHEVGGNEDQNILKDADSLSFFEKNIDFFVTVMVKRTSKDEVKEKFDWMFNRISLKEAKEIARPWYEEAINRLESLE